MANKASNDLVDKLLSKVPKDKGVNKSSWPRFAKNYQQSADLLFLPHDGIYKYALVVVDNGSRLVDAIPLSNKNAKHVADNFDELYKKSKILDIPKYMYVDDGTEFKGACAK